LLNFSALKFSNYIKNYDETFNLFFFRLKLFHLALNHWY